MRHGIWMAAAAVLLLSGAAQAVEPGQSLTKSKRKAVALSLAATLAPAAAGAALAAVAPSDAAQAAGVGLVALGLALGPGAGRLYADGSISPSLTVRRLLGVGLAMAGVAAATHGGNEMIAAQTDGWKSTGSLVVAGLGLSLVSVNAVRDIVAATHAVDDFNRPKPRVEWNVGAKYFSEDKALGASITFKF